MHRVALTALFSVVVSLPAWADSEPEAKKITLAKGDRIVFLGDSITEAGAGRGGYVTMIREALNERHKDLGIEVIGAGISGNKVPDLQRRLERDVLKRKPTLVVIYIGINDVWHGERDPKNGTSKEQYEEGLKDVIGRIHKGGARVLICTPSVIGEKADGSNFNDKKLDEYRRSAGRWPRNSRCRCATCATRSSSTSRHTTRTPRRGAS